MMELIENNTWFDFEQDGQVYKCWVDHYSWWGKITNERYHIITISLRQTRKVKYLYFLTREEILFEYEYSSSISRGEITMTDEKIYFNPESIKLRIINALDEASKKPLIENRNTIKSISSLK